MNRRGRLLPALLLCLLPSCGCAIQTAGSRFSAATVELPATVDHVVDGDTLDVLLDGHRTRVRTVQIDAPESSALRFGHPDHCGEPAKEFARTLVHRGEHVTLELAGSERHDRYGRTLALVHLGGARAITWQQRMVSAGWATVFVVKGNRTRLLDTLRAEEADAREHHLGVYGLCHGQFHEESG